MKYVIAYDLGTGGLKASIFDDKGFSVGSDFKPCDTYHPANDFREQRPQEWWDIVVSATKGLLAKTSVSPGDIVAVACSGHSLGVVPIGRDGKLLLDSVPIWYDARAAKQAHDVFSKLDEAAWYMKTGNGFPAPLYSAFKLLWYRDNMPDVYEAAEKFIGTKDYLNYRLTGVLGTDFSYASGSGVYDLLKCDYDFDYIKAFGLSPVIFPALYESSHIIGKITPQAAGELGLSQNTLVAAGGVDNACMCTGAGCVNEGMAYTSLGTSAWIAVSSSKPVVNAETRPYVFAHLIKGMYTSATSIFSAGNTYKWVRDTICPDLKEKENAGGEDAYRVMDRMAATSPPGANGLFFTPTLAGGNSLDRSKKVKGAITGLDLRHSRNDIVRAALEGVCLGLRMALGELKKEVVLSDEMLIVGGGSKSPFWRQLFADVYGMNITESAVGENAGSLGAMACAAIGAGIWTDYSPLIELNKPINALKPNPGVTPKYDEIYKAFRKINKYQSDIAESVNHSS